MTLPLGETVLFAGWVAMAGGDTTVKVVWLLMLPEVAVMVVTPSVKAVAIPLVLMEATAGLLLDQSEPGPPFVKTREEPSL